MKPFVHHSKSIRPPARTARPCASTERGTVIRGRSVLSYAMRLLPRSSSALAILALLLPMPQATGCGPNLRTVYDGEVEFERCVGIDRDEAAPVGERMACWSNWQQFYAASQSPDRVQYARNRINALSSQGGLSSGGQQSAPYGAPGPSGPNVQASAPRGDAPSSTPSAPTASGAPARSPGGMVEVNGVIAVNSGRDGSSGAIGSTQGSAAGQAPAPASPPPSPSTSAAPRPVPAPPGASCSGSCREQWNGCSAPCNGEAACIARCDDSYRECMRGCY